MEFRRLGKSGLQVSEIGLGTNNFGGRTDEQGSIRVIDQALDEGVNLIDTSNSYSKGLSETIIGKAVKGKRQQAVIATKVFSPMQEGPNQRGASRSIIMREVEDSLRRLDTDYIDLYQIHFNDPDTPIEETLRTLNDLVRQGKTRYIGCSNFNAWQTCEAIHVAKSLNLEPFVSVQPDYSILNREIEKELLPFCQAYQIGILPFYPLAAGLLTGKYRRGQPIPEGTRLSLGGPAQKRWINDQHFDILERLEEFTEERGHSLLDLAFAWLLANPNISSVIAGATKPEQITANVKTLEWRLNQDDLRELNTLLDAT